MEKAIKILLVATLEQDYKNIKKTLSKIPYKKCNLDWLISYDDALKIISSQKHDILLIEYNLDKKNGLDLIKETINRNMRIPAILLTDQSDRKIETMAMQEGATDFIPKDKIAIDVLERAIRYALARKKADEKIFYLAYYDNLTDLPNRTLFTDRLVQALANAKRYSRMCSIIQLDLDNFKKINDTHGHRIGDLLLKEVSKRLINSIRKTENIKKNKVISLIDTVSRLGGDEFMILLSEISHIENSSIVARRIISSLKEKFNIKGHEIYISASIGIATYPNDGENYEVLLKAADTAMYEAKRCGKNTYQYYKSTLRNPLQKHLNWENDLRNALELKQFEVHYQPQLNIQTGKIFGLEALIHWNYPKKGVFSPHKFIPLAEEIGLISQLENIVLNEVCAHCNYWQSLNLLPKKISFNVSRKQFYNLRFFDTIIRTIDQFNLDHKLFILEVTETALADNNLILKTLKKMNHTGIKIALDDFGIGFSSIANLLNMPIDMIKIDYSFIKNIRNKKNSIIVSSILLLADKLKVPVVAEGVEKKYQLQYLHSNNCQIIQGFLFARPHSADEIVKILKKEKKGEGIGKIFIEKYLS